MDEIQQQEELNFRTKLLVEWFENGGAETIWDLDLIRDMGKMKKDAASNVIRSTVSPRVNALMLAMQASQMSPPPYSGKDLIDYGSFYQKGLFIEQVKVDTVDQFQEILTKELERKHVLYRGMREAKWQMYSSLQRQWLGKHLQNSGISYQEFIQCILDHARKEHHGLLVKYFHENGFHAQNDLAILSFLQHHGCPTPLLDWTYDFPVSLFFGIRDLQPNAGSKEIENYFSVCHIEEQYLSTASLKGIIEEFLVTKHEVVRATVLRRAKESGSDPNEVQKTITEETMNETARMLYGAAAVSYATRLENLMETPLTYFSDYENAQVIRFALNNSLNIVSQNGVFTWNADPAKSLEHMSRKIREADHGSSDGYKFCRCYNINKGLVDHIRDQLNGAGVTEDAMFPDPGKLAFAAFEKSKEANLNGGMRITNMEQQ